MSTEPLTPLVEGAVQLHELWLAYVRAGFTSEQAMQLVVAMIQTSLNRGTEEP